MGWGAFWRWCGLDRIACTERNQLAMPAMDIGVVSTIGPGRRFALRLYRVSQHEGLQCSVSRFVSNNPIPGRMILLQGHFCFVCGMGADCIPCEIRRSTKEQSEEK